MLQKNIDLKEIGGVQESQVIWLDIFWFYY